jgi:hypothetical protein
MEHWLHIDGVKHYPAWYKQEETAGDYRDTQGLERQRRLAQGRN